MDRSSDGQAEAARPLTTIIDAANVAALVANYQEAVASTSKSTPDQTSSDIDRLIMSAAIGEGMEAIAAAQRDPGVFYCPEHPVGATILTVLEELSLEVGGVVPSDVDGQEATFDEKDRVKWALEAGPDWLGAKVKEKLKFLDNRATFKPGPEEPEVMTENVRVAILGDWGTNLYGAPHCAKSIRDDPKPPQVLIHLGDVYYTGTTKAIQERFLNPWPKVANAWNRACNSNHEMLGGGGRPYRDLTLKAFRQSSPMWWLQNSAWSLIGLDTAYTDGTVNATQLEWLTKVLRQSRDSGRRTIAFSHHPPWSTGKLTLENKLVKPLTEILEENLLDGWYFGHEHLCCLFERHPRWGMYAACVGHSGYPYWTVSINNRTEYRVNGDGSSWWRHEGTDNVPASYLLSGKNPFIPGHEKRYGPNGYAMLDLGESEWTETIHEPNGTPIGVRTLQPELGSAGKVSLP